MWRPLVADDETSLLLIRYRVKRGVTGEITSVNTGVLMSGMWGITKDDVLMRDCHLRQQSTNEIDLIIKINL